MRPDPRNAFEKKIGRQEQRKLIARGRQDRSVWQGLGMMGMVGWSVAVPALIGVALGVWIDAHSRSGYSWTLMLLLAGVILGCINAWHWVKKERKGE
jgi:ATP synthase protein I